MSFLGPDIELKPGWNSGPRWRQRWWWRERIPGLVTVVVLATLMVLAGWLPFYFNDRGDDRVARPSDTSSGEPRSPAPSGTPRPTEQPPELPEAAHQFSDKGIEAAVRFEYAALNYGQRTGDLAALKSIFNLAECKTCTLLIDRLSANLQDGARYVDGEYSLVSIEARTSIGNGGEGIGTAKVSEGQPKEAILVGSNGKELKRRAVEPKTPLTFNLGFIGGQWVIQEISPGKKS